jgi:hypothetical protein
MLYGISYIGNDLGLTPDNQKRREGRDTAESHLVDWCWRRLVI